MDKKTDNNKDFEYTIVMDASYRGPELESAGSAGSADDGKADVRKEADLLYDAYERMCLKEPTVLDKDDAYPHSYQWRVGDKYDPEKIGLIKAALKEGKLIADTDAYQEYIETIKNRKFKPESWD